MKRHLGLDVLRGFAVLFVLLAHLPDGPPNPLTRLFQRTGWIGVDLFFVLSGFLVSGLLFREHQRHGALRIGRFLIRRGLKIYPAYYVFLLFTVGWFALLRIPWSWTQLGLQLVYLQNYGFPLYGHGVHFWSHTWTLAVEEHFYLLLAVWLLLASRRPGPNPFRAVPWVCGALSVVCLGLRVWMAGRPPFEYETHFQPTHLRLDSLTTGVALSYFLNYARPTTEAILRRGWPLLVPVGLALYLVVPGAYELHETPWMKTFGPTIVAVGAMLLVGVTAVHEWRPFPPLRWLATVGFDSYSIYLWHMIVLSGQGLLIAGLRLIRIPGDLPLYAAFGTAYVAASIGLGILMARLIELPVLRWRDRVWPSRSTPVDPEPESDVADGNPSRDPMPSERAEVRSP